MRQLNIRNTPDGCIWQVYHVRDDHEVRLLQRSAMNNGFSGFEVAKELTDNETFPGWRNDDGWHTYLRDNPAPKGTEVY
jgi:hypothetical protein